MVSVIIPVHNSEQFLAETIESVLAQSYRPIEVIVVDDGSTDESANIARSFDDVHYIHQANQGTAVARNNGIAASKGEFFSFLDHDDVCLPNKLELQVGHLLEHPHVGFTICMIDNFLDPMLKSIPEDQSVPMMDEKISFSSMLVRREIFERVGGFDPDYRLANDLEWVTRAKDLGVQMTILPHVLIRRRIHEANLSHDRQGVKADLFRLIKASIDRQADQGGQ